MDKRDVDKEKASKKFGKTGRGRRQDHGTRDNAHRHRYHEDYYSGQTDAERAIARRAARNGADEPLEALDGDLEVEK